LLAVGSQIFNKHPEIRQVKVFFATGEIQKIMWKRLFENHMLNSQNQLYLTMRMISGILHAVPIWQLFQVGFLISIDKRQQSHDVTTNEFPELPQDFTIAFLQDN